MAANAPSAEVSSAASTAAGHGEGARGVLSNAGVAPELLDPDRPGSECQPAVEWCKCHVAQHSTTVVLLLCQLSSLDLARMLTYRMCSGSNSGLSRSMTAPRLFAPPAATGPPAIAV